MTLRGKTQKKDKAARLWEDEKKDKITEVKA